MLICVYPRIVRQSDTHTGGYDLENRSDKEIRLNLICKKIIEKLE